MCQACDVGEFGADHQAGGGRGRFVADLSPYTKLALLAAGLLLNLISVSVGTSAVLGASLLLLLLLTGIRPGTLLRRLVVPWYIALVALATQLFMTGTTPLLQVGPLTGYSEGLSSGIMLGSRIFAGTTLVLAFSLMTSVTELLSLASRLRLSPVLIEIASLTYRYMFLLAEEAGRIREAQAARLGHISWRKSMRSYSILVGMLMARSYDKAESVYQAMTSRGYQGTFPAGVCGRVGVHDVLASAVALAFMLTLTWLGWRYGI